MAPWGKAAVEGDQTYIEQKKLLYVAEGLPTGNKQQPDFHYDKLKRPFSARLLSSKRQKK